MVDEAVHLIGQRVIGNIGENENILAAAGIHNHALAFAGAEANAFRVHPVIVADIALKGGIRLRNIVIMLPEGYQIIIDFFSQSLGRGKNDKLKRSHRNAALQLLVQLKIRHEHTPCIHQCKGFADPGSLKMKSAIRPAIRPMSRLHCTFNTEKPQAITQFYTVR